MIKNIQIKISPWLKSIFTHSKWYFLANLSTKALAFFLLPIYTIYLTPADYGVLNSLEVVGQILPVFFSFSLASAFNRFFHEDSQNKIYLQELFSTVFWFILVVGMIAILLLLLSAKFWLPSLLDVPIFYAYIAFPPILFMQLALIGHAFFRQSLQARMVSLILVGSALVNVSVSIFLLIYQDLGVLARLWGNLGAAFFSFLFICWYTVRKKLLNFVFNIALLRKCLTYSMPMMPMIASVWINSVSDRLVIAKYVDMEAVGLYSIAFHISTILYFTGDSITQVLAPITMKGLIEDKEKTKKKIQEYSFFLWILMLFASIFLFFFSKELIQLFLAKSFQEAHKIIPLLAAATIFGMQYRLYAQIINYYKKTYLFTYASIGCAIINLGLNIIFVPHYGYIAAVWTTLLSSILYSSYIIRESKRLEEIPFSTKSYVISFSIFLLLVLLSYQAFFTLLWKVAIFSFISIFVGKFIWKNNINLK